MWPHLQLSARLDGRSRARSPIPLGLWLGHIGKGGFLAINASNVGRAVPSLALIAFFVAYIGVGFSNLTLALVLLAIPPILTNAYSGVRQVDRDTVDAARGMGMTGAQIVRRVELPLALPLIFGGIRISAVNVIATATIAPLAGVDHARRPDHQREHLRRRGQARGGDRRGPARRATEFVLGAVQRAVTPRGLKLEGGSRWRRLAFGIPTTEGKHPHENASLARCCSRCWSPHLRVAACGDDDEGDGGGVTPTPRGDEPPARSRRTTRTRRPRSRSARRTSPSRSCSARSTRRR